MSHSACYCFHRITCTSVGHCWQVLIIGLVDRRRVSQGCQSATTSPDWIPPLNTSMSWVHTSIAIITNQICCPTCVCHNRKIALVLDMFQAAGHYHPSLYCDIIYVEQPYWIEAAPNQFLDTGTYQCQYKYQHICEVQSCSLEGVSGELLDDSCWEKLPETDHVIVDNSVVNSRRAHARHIARNVKVKVTLERSVRAPTPGQYMTFYRNDQCLGSAQIYALGPSVMEKGGTVDIGYVRVENQYDVAWQ